MKRILLLVSLVLVIAAAAACGTGGEPAVTTEPVATEDVSPANLEGWFDYGSALYEMKTENITVKNAMDSISIDMAKNEIEGFEYIITSDKAVSGLRCDVTALSDGNGNELNGTVYVAQYTYLARTDHNLEHTRGFYPVALLPIDDEYQGGSFDVAAGAARTLYVSYKTDIDTVPGTYTGTLTVSRNGETLFSGGVSVRVRDVYYDEKTECLTLIGLYYDKADANPNVPEGPESAPALGWQQTKEEYANEELIRKYADFMLENRFCPSYLPLEDDLLSEDAAYYLDNPRYNSVYTRLIPDWWRKSQEHLEDLAKKYEVAKERGWLDKIYFSYFDEPHEDGQLKQIFAEAKRSHFEGCVFPTTNLLDAILVDLPSADGKKNIIDRMSAATTAYCPKVELFTGSIKESMLRQKAERGDTLFWYVCSGSTADTINRLPCTPGTDKRLLFWMQYQQNIDGFLYWRATYWNRSADVWADDYMTKGYRKTESFGEGTDEGVMIYWHPITKEPVSTLGFEAMRDGVEDFQLLKMVEAKFGRDKALEYAEQLATDINKFVRYRKGSTTLLNELRSQLFDLLENA
ncbi:MAG: DUF4091 domain-containing protein [Clostridia bacterium]|nr:DUF4091 domain-containing protein [Clostridia bacterium]